MTLQNRVALITGSAQGIGKAIATHLAEAGACVGVNDIKEQKVLETVNCLKSKGLKVVPCIADVTMKEQINSAVEKLLEHYGRIDILINNAGVIRDRSITKMTEEDWDFVLDTDLKSYFLCSQAVIPTMIKQRYGRIVNISSRAWLGGFGQANYSAAKGGVVSLTKSLAIELARYKITANAIAPGLIKTPMFDNFKPEVQEKLLRMQPTGEIGNPKDVAFAVQFFAADEAGYITGQILHVCGGKSLGAYIPVQ